MASKPEVLSEFAKSMKELVTLMAEMKHIKVKKNAPAK
jgi:hypothetical protein